MCRLLPRYNTGAMVRSLVDDEITYLVAVPAVFSLIVRRPPRTPLSLQLALYGGAPMNVPTMRALVDLVPGVRAIQGYGMTEITSLATALPEDQALRAPGSVGVPSPITELRLVDERGAQVAGPGSLGEILLRGPHRTPGYWRRPDLTAQAIDGQGWLHSGDIAWRDETGLLYLAGRKNQMINRGGEKIAPRELENALMDIPGIADAVAFGIADEVLHEVPGAAVIPAEGRLLQERAIQAALRARLAPFKRPVRIWILDSFPLSSTGKVNYEAIRQQGTR
jgi:acyl-CoA synthetase (AMP-forming)/AMP-acid ligase II